MATAAPRAVSVRGRESRLSTAVAAMEQDALKWLREVFEVWGLEFRGTDVTHVPGQLDALGTLYRQLAASIGDADLESLAVTSYESSLRRERVTPEGKSLALGLLLQTLNHDTNAKARSITAVGAAAWRDNPYVTQSAECRGCGFRIPAKEGAYSYETRKKAPPTPSLPECPECGDAFGDDDGE